MKMPKSLGSNPKLSDLSAGKVKPPNGWWRPEEVLCAYVLLTCG